MSSLLQTNFWTVSRCIFVFFVSQLSPTLYIRFYPDTIIEFTCFLFCTVFLSIIVPYNISTSKLKLSCPVCCAGSFSSLSTLSSHSSHTLSVRMFNILLLFSFVLYIKKTTKKNKPFCFRMSCFIAICFCARI